MKIWQRNNLILSPKGGRNNKYSRHEMYVDGYNYRGVL